jgi:hypothetical protein
LKTSATIWASKRSTGPCSLTRISSRPMSATAFVSAGPSTTASRCSRFSSVLRASRLRGRRGCSLVTQAREPRLRRALFQYICGAHHALRPAGGAGAHQILIRRCSLRRRHVRLGQVAEAADGDDGGLGGHPLDVPAVAGCALSPAAPNAVLCNVCVGLLTGTRGAK